MDKIFIPDSIGIYIDPKLNTWKSKSNLFLHFEDRLLGGDKHCFKIRCFNFENYKRVDCYLQACKHKNLQAGDLAFCTGSDTVYPDNLSGYCIIINSASFAYINDDGTVQVSTANPSQFNWYKALLLYP